MTKKKQGTGLLQKNAKSSLKEKNRRRVRIDHGIYGHTTLLNIRIKTNTRVKSVAKRIALESSYILKKSMWCHPLTAKKTILELIRLLYKAKNELTLLDNNSNLEYKITHRTKPTNKKIDISIILCEWDEQYIQEFLKILSKTTDEYKRKLEVLAISRDNSRKQDGSAKNKERKYKKRLGPRSNARNSLAKSRNQAGEIAQGEILIFADKGSKITLQIIDLAIKEIAKETNGCVIIPNIPKGSNRLIQKEWVNYQDIVHYSNLLKAFVPDIGISTSKKNKSNKSQDMKALIACRRSEFNNLSGFTEYHTDIFLQADYCLKNKLILNKEAKIYTNQESPGIRNSILPLENIFTYSQARHKDISKLNKSWGEEQKSLYLNTLSTSRRRSFKVGIIVSEDYRYTKYGDYYTALELSIELRNLNWKVELIPVKGKKQRFQYDMSNIDCIINLLHDWDIGKAYNCRPSLIKVCWMRNWFESWWESKHFLHYDIFLGSSKKACSYIEEMTGQEVHLFRIAGNQHKFKKGRNDKIGCIFTGNHWKAKRDIEDFKPNARDIEFKLYGNGWEKHPNLSKYAEGAKNYDELPKLYQEAKILIDDANHVTKTWGSTNSRVFDGILSGNLVITNSKETSLDTFDGILPSYKNADELSELVCYYLKHSEARINLAKQLRKMVLSQHTYKLRSHELRDILRNFIENKQTLSIKIPVPNTANNQYWGDFHYACGIAKEFRSKNWKVRIDPITHWYQGRCIEADVTLNLKGLSKYKPCKKSINLAWIISHPELIDIKDLQNFDHIFVASRTYKHRISSVSNIKNISTLLQCTDPSKFYRLNNQHCDGITHKSILFVGNSRNQARTIVMNAIKAKYNLHVYGSLWEKIIPNRFIKGNSLRHSDLNRYYQSCGVLLNDHWDLMRKEGFISNRLFDGAASGATIVSDKVDGIKEVFGGSIYEYDGTAIDLKKKVDLALQERNSLRMVEIRKKISYQIAKQHSFEARSKQILSVIKELRDAQDHTTILIREQNIAINIASGEEAK